MTEAQLKVLAQLNKDELLVAINSLAWLVCDLDVALAASEAMQPRLARLRTAWREASALTDAASQALAKRPGSTAARKRFRKATDISESRWQALQRAQDQHSRVLKVETPL